MKKAFTTFLFLLLLSKFAFAQSANYYETYIIIGSTFYDAGASTGNPDFQNTNLGTFACNGSLVLNGAETNTKKSGSCDITGSKMMYRVYKQGSPTFPTFTEVILPFSADFGSCFSNSGTCQRWKKDNHGLNLISGLSNGTYVLEVYFVGSTQFCGVGDFYDSNSSNNYKATFVVNSPITIGTASASPTVICYGSNATISVASPSGGDTFYWQKKNVDNSWSNVSTGSFSTSVPDLSITNLIENATYRCRITNCGGLNEAISNEITISPQRPAITLQPNSQTDCDGNTVDFIVNAATGTTFTWQRKKPLDVSFVTVSATTNSVITTTTGASELKVRNIGNAENPHLSLYQCVITDANGCTNTSNQATLSVNSINNITNANPICEGGSTLLTVSFVGTPNSIKWQKGTSETSAASYADVTDNAIFSGSSTNTLSLTNVTNAENNTYYRVRAVFPTVLNSGAGTCTQTQSVTATTTGKVTVNPNPTAPTVTNQARCGSGTITLTASSSFGTNEVYKWYADNTTTSVLQQSTSASYTTTSLAVGTYTYYLSVLNTSTACESSRTAVTATVNEIPSITLASVTAICPQATSFDLPFSAISGTPNQYSIIAGSPALAGFTAVNNATLGTSPISVPIPTNSLSATYQFSISVNNSTTTCVSPSQNFNVTIKNPTIVTGNPNSQTICEGQTLSLTASGTGDGTVTYQWRKAGINISGETNSTYSITNIALNQAGNYDCLVIADCGTATTNIAIITVNPKANFSTHPINQAVCRENSATFSISASGTGTLLYRWKKGSTILTDGTNILGSTTNEILLTNLQLADAGTYVCEVKGSCDADYVSSNTATLTVNDLPIAPIVVSPINYCQNATATALSATASGTNNLLWYGTNSTGGASSASAPTPLTNTAGTTKYYVSQKDGNNCESPRAEITVIVLPAVSGTVSGFDKICGSGVINNATTLTANPSGGNGIYTYQWQNASGNITSASNSTYNVTNAFQSGNTDTYQVIIVSGGCTATSSNAIIVSKQAWADISITGNTPDICGSGTKTLSIVSPVGGATYKWFADATTTTDLQTGTSFTAPNLTSATTYFAAREGLIATGLTCQSNRASATINVNPVPSAPIITSSDADNIVCSGESISLTANGCAGNILWSNGSASSVIIVSASGTYNATCAVGSCTSSASATLTIVVNALQNPPTISSSDADNIVCSGETISLTANGCAGTLLWNNGNSASIITISTSGTYNATCTVNGCTSLASAIQNIVENSLPNFTTNPIDQTNCKGNQITFSAATNLSPTYQWEYRKLPTDTFSTVASATASTLTITNIGSTTYPHRSEFRLKATSNGCISYSTSAFLNVNSVTGTMIDPTVCSGNNATFDLSTITVIGSPTIYQWQSSASEGSGYANNGLPTGTTLTINNLTSVNNNSYYACLLTFPKTPSGTCTERTDGGKPIVTTINPPTVNGATAICQGQSTNLTASGCGGTITWNNNATGSTLNVSTSSTYSATCTQSGCTSLVSNIHILTVNPVPTAPTISSSDADNIVCFGTTVSLTANGCVGNILWSNGNSSSIITISSSGTYTATCTENNCPSLASVIQNIIVNPIPPTPEIAGNTTLCNGQSTNLTASGCNGSILWSNGSTTSTITISTAGTYNVTCTINNCQSLPSITQNVVVNPKPAKPTISGNNTACSGSLTILTANGCNGTITWNNASSGSTLSISAAGSYTATCTENGCLSDVSDAFVLSENPLPTITLGTIDNVCFTATTFNLSYSATTNSPNVFSLTANMPDFVGITDASLGSSPLSITIPSGKNGTHTFTISVKNTITGCSSVAQIFNLSILPSLNAGSIEATPTPIYCAGYNAGTISNVATASGGKTAYIYQWEQSTDGINFTEIVSQIATSYDPPALTTTTYFRRKVTDACGEIKYSNIHQITISPDPSGTITATTPTTICAGNTVSFSATTTGGAGSCTIKWQSSNSSSTSGTWTDEQVGGTTFTTSALNTVGNKYFRIFYDCDVASCNQFLSTPIHVTINSNPTVPTVSGGGTICSGQSINLTATSCNGTLNWSNGRTTSIISVSTAGTYTATCTNSCGMSVNSNSAIVNVTTINPPTLTGSTSICSGQTTNLTASGCNGIVNWSNGSSGTLIVVSPSTTTNYIATCTENSCTSGNSNQITITVNQSIIFSVETIADVCNSATSFSLPYTLTTGTADKYSLTGNMTDFIGINDSNLGNSPLSITIPSGKTGTFSFTLTLKNTSSGCSVAQVFNLTVVPTLSAGSIETSSSTINCAGYNAGVISNVATASGGKTAYTYQWEQSTDGVNFTEIASQIVTSYDPPALTTTTYFRRKVTDACGEIKYSNIHQINIVPDPQITIIDASDRTICSGNTISLSAILAGGSGTCTPIWQSANSPSGTWTDEQTGGTGFSKTLTNTSATPSIKYYRAIYDCSGTGSGSCNQGVSSNVKVTVNYIPNAPTVSPSSVAICQAQSALLTASGCSGTITWSNGQTGSTLSTSTAGTYSAKCTFNNCESIFGNIATVIVSSNGNVNPPTIGNSATICQGQTVNLTATNCVGLIIWSNGNTGTSININPSISTNYTANCFDGNCTSGESNQITITVNPLPNITTQPQNQSDCKGNGVSFSVSANVSSGTISYQWQRKKPSETAFSDIIGATNSSLSLTNVGNGDNLHQSEYRCILTGTGGCSVTSNAVTLTVNSITGTLASQSVCEGNNISIDLNSLTIVGNPTFQWQKKNGTIWENVLDGTTISGSTTNLLNINNLTTSNTGNYRNRMVFNLVPSGTCTINSDEMTLTVSAIPTSPTVVSPVSYCQNSVATALSATPSSGNTLLWYTTATGGVGSTSAIVPNTSSVGTFSYYVSQKTSGNCESQRAEIQVIIRAGVAAPTNTTPASVTPPATLTFSASPTVLGATLLWYNSASTGIGSATAPVYTAIGTYTHWVSQTDPISGCESPRLQINSQILNIFRIIAHPGTQADCRGNSVYMDVTATGPNTNFTYQWQRKRPTDTDFINLTTDGGGINGWFSKTMRVSNVGNGDNPHLTQYRCLVSDGTQTLQSNAATLHVNSVIGSLQNVGACLGGNTNINLNNFGITGNVLSYQWQTRPGTSGAWSNVSDGNGISGSASKQLNFSNIQFSNSAYYRCVVKFNTMGVICDENTDPALLSIGGFPGSPSVSDIFYCQFANTSRLKINTDNNDFDVVWYPQASGGVGSTTAPLPNSASAGVFSYFVSYRTEQGCESPRAELKVTIGEQPKAPQNTTAGTVNEGTILTFSAGGERLKWFTTPTTNTFSTVAPTFATAGTYVRYVSQLSAFSCESPRTTIVSTIIPSLKFTKQPISEADCDGNSVTFSVASAGKGNLTYQWQRQKPTETIFTDILNEKTTSLKIENIGNTDNPHLTKYRCIIKDENGTLVSEEVFLTVNAIKGTFKNLSLCDGKSAELNLKDLTITGKVVSYQWQKKSGSEYIDLVDGKDAIFNAKEIGTYRCRVFFEVDSRTTCPRNTDDIVIVNRPTPMPPQVTDAIICQNNANFLIVNQVKATNALLWYDTADDKIGKTTTPKPDFSKTGKTTYFVSQITTFGCESERKSFDLTIAPIPNKPTTTAEISFCRNAPSEALKATTETGNQILWYASLSATTALPTIPIPTTQNDGIVSYFVSAKNQAGCESPRVETKITVSLCIATFENNFNNCLVASTENVTGNRWFDLFDANGRLYASVNPNGLNLGKVTIQIKHYGKGVSAIPKTTNETRLMARYLDFQSSLLKTFTQPVSVKIYYENSEFNDYKQAINQPNLTINDFNIVHYDGVREDCGFENNDNFKDGESYVIYKNVVGQQVIPSFFSLQFDVNEFSENAATANDFTELTYNHEKIEEKSVKSSWKTTLEVKAEKFIIQRSQDGKIWVNLKEVKANGNPSSYETIDYQPLSGKSFYRTVYIDKDGTKKYYGPKEVNFDDAFCQVFPNPTDDKTNLNLYYRNINAKEIQIVDILGQKMGFNSTKTEIGIFQLKPTIRLSAGTYFVVIIDENGKRCMQKVVVNP